MNILDVACGGKMFYFDKNDERVLFLDKRQEEHILCDGRKFSISPQLKGDFTKLQFLTGSFKLVVFDPPHFKKLGKNSWMAKKYGVLESDWKETITIGFKECFRVLDKNGILIFKWNEAQISIKDVLNCTPKKPLFGHRTMINNKTIWIAFIKD